MSQIPRYTEKEFQAMMASRRKPVASSSGERPAMGGGIGEPHTIDQKRPGGLFPPPTRLGNDVKSDGRTQQPTNTNKKGGGGVVETTKPSNGPRCRGYSRRRP